MVPKYPSIHPKNSCFKISQYISKGLNHNTFFQNNQKCHNIVSFTSYKNPFHFHLIFIEGPQLTLKIYYYISQLSQVILLLAAQPTLAVLMAFLKFYINFLFIQNL